MGVCVICKSRTGKDSGKTFHKFPLQKNPDMAARWIKWVCTVKKTNWVPAKMSIICSDHFDANCFDRSMFRVDLIRNSVPSIVRPGEIVTIEAETSPNRKPHLAIKEQSLTYSEVSVPNFCAESVKEECLEDIRDISETTAAENGYNFPSIPASIIKIENPNSSTETLNMPCNPGRRRSLLHHDHNYEDSPRTSRMKFIAMKKNLSKYQTLVRTQKQHIRRMKRKIESLKEMIRSLMRDSKRSS